MLFKNLSVALLHCGTALICLAFVPEAKALSGADCLENGGLALCTAAKPGPWRLTISAFDAGFTAIDAPVCRGKGGTPHGTAGSFWCENPSEPYSEPEVTTFADAIGAEYFSCG